MPLDLGVKVVDKFMEKGLEEPGGRDDPLAVDFGPAYVRLELTITAKQPIGVHNGISRRSRGNKKTHAPPCGGCVGLHNPSESPVS